VAVIVCAITLLSYTYIKQPEGFYYKLTAKPRNFLFHRMRNPPECDRRDSQIVSLAIKRASHRAIEQWMIFVESAGCCCASLT